MSSGASPLKITIEFLPVGNVRHFSGFTFEPREYQVRHSNGALKIARFPWNDSEFRKDFEQLSNSTRASTPLESMGKCLRGFLATTDWARYEAEIEQALKSRRPIDIIIRSNAPELYYLPWELLPIESSSRQLHELPNCLVRYEWPQQTSDERAPRFHPRILIAASAEGGAIPFEEHLQAINRSCQQANFHPRVKLDVLYGVTRETLAEALSDATRPVTAVHLLCHGSMTEEAAHGLVLNPADPHDEPDVLDAPEMRRRFVGSTRSLRLVTLCVCQSGDAGRPAHPLGSVAQMLHRQGVPAVIASRMPLSTEASVLLTATLYEDLLCGSRSLRAALPLTREKLRNRLKTHDWASLQLYAREADEEGLHPFTEPPLRSPQAPLEQQSPSPRVRSPGALQHIVSTGTMSDNIISAGDVNIGGDWRRKP